jgi:MYXO-CTERM domain-containing protein
VCETTREEAFCLPAPVACTPETGCEGDDICYDIPNKGAPEGYAEVDFACWPPGLVGSVEGYVAPARDGSVLNEADSEPASKSGAGAAQGDDGATADSDAPGIKSQSGGCTISNRSAGGSSGLAALAVMVGLALLRRRT